MVLPSDPITIVGIVERFSGKGGWFYVRVPQDQLPPLPSDHPWGFKNISVTLGKVRWETALMPMGDGTDFIALKTDVRRRENIVEGDSVRLTFTPKI